MEEQLLTQTFRAFWGAINNELHLASSINQNWSLEYPISGEYTDSGSGLVLTHKVKSSKVRNGVEFFMFSGTLLGSYRHHGRIPWDDDIDVIFNSSDKEAVKATLSKLEPEYGLDDSYKNRSWKFFPRAGKIIFFEFVILTTYQSVIPDK